MLVARQVKSNSGIPGVAWLPPWGQHDEILTFSPFSDRRRGHTINSIFLICLEDHLTLPVVNIARCVTMHGELHNEFNSFVSSLMYFDLFTVLCLPKPRRSCQVDNIMTFPGCYIITLIFTVIIYHKFSLKLKQFKHYFNCCFELSWDT